MPLLFTKEDCNKCEFLKTKIDLEDLNIKEMKLTSDDAHVLALAAWYDIIEEKMPVLITDNNKPVVGVINILRYLKKNNN